MAAIEHDPQASRRAAVHADRARERFWTEPPAHARPVTDVNLSSRSAIARALIVPL